MTIRSQNVSPSSLARPVAGLASRVTKLPPLLIVLTLLGVAAVAGVTYGWQQWGRNVIARPVYQIAAENIQITPPPPWIKTDIRAEVIRDGALADLTVFDKDVTIRAYHAFELHPWVAKVRRVAKYPPARLDVELEYRKPLAWVEVPRGVMPGGEGGVIPIDESAIVLPSNDFTSEDVGNYIRISAPGITACGLAGTAWGDSRIAGAARIAEVLKDMWQDSKLFRIRISTSPELTKQQSDPIYELETKDRQRIIWGHAPGSEHTNELSIRAKLERLRQIVQSPSARAGTSEIVGDLRSNTAP